MRLAGESFSKQDRTMTSDRKFVPKRRGALQSSSLRWKAMLGMSVLLLGCKSTSAPSAVSRTPEQREELKAILNAKRLVDCKIVNQEWFVPGDVQQAEIVRNKSSLALIYQALLRSGPRTIYQPLTPGLAFDGDGISVGQKSAPNVTDFKTVDDSAGNMWTISRFKAADTEIYKGLVEVIVKNKNVRTVLPTAANMSVQQIWITQPAGNGAANIVVRTTPIEESENNAGVDESTFQWFQLGSTENSARLMGTVKPANTIIQPSAFVALEKTAEPVAIAITQSRGAEDSIDSPSLSSGARVSLHRLFSPQRQERAIFEGKGLISSLHVSPPNSTGIHLAWLFSTQQRSGRYLQTTTLSVRVIPERFFSKARDLEREPLLVTELDYEANEPEFLFTANQSQAIPVLGWWAKLEKDVALLMQPVVPQFRTSLSTSLKSPDGRSLGLSFSPSLGILPPKNFNRVMTIKAAPTATEKNIAVFSNRSDSAELQTESFLYPCTF
jgi:hypothetical protein